MQYGNAKLQKKLKKMVDKTKLVCYNAHIEISKGEAFMFASAMMMDMAMMYMQRMCMRCHA